VLSAYLIELGTFDIILALLVSLCKVTTRLRYSGELFGSLCENRS